MECTLHKGNSTTLFCRTHSIWMCEYCLKDHKECNYPQHFTEILEKKTHGSKDSESEAKLLNDTVEKEIESVQSLQSELARQLLMVENQIDTLQASDVDLESQDHSQKEIQLMKAIRYNIKETSGNNFISNTYKTFSDLNELIKRAQLTVSLINYCICKSTIVNTMEYSTLLDWIDPKKPPICQLLFRASRDGFSSESFHQHCDSQKPTLVIVKTNFNKIIGGYAAMAWSSVGGYSNDHTRTSFMYSLSLNKKFVLKCPEYSISNSAQHGPKFGGGHDLEIVSNCDKMQNAYFNLNHSYICDKNCTEVYGGQHFKVLDYEVFKVVI